MRDKALITSALPYANGEIHLGHVASTYLPADTTTRYLRMRGVEAYFVCASDDYGTPILIQSERENKAPEQYAAHWNKRDQEDFAALNIDFDFFSRTSSPENIKFVQYVFDKLNEAGHIYSTDIIQYYCTHDKKFLPDRYVRGTCPKCHAKNQYSDLCEACGNIPEKILEPKCALCGQTPIMKPSLHYFFQLKNFSQSLEEWLDSNSNLQPDVKKYIKNWIKDGLVDWDITRDIHWGIPVPLPEAAGKVFYGWFDNHLAYISSTIKFLNEKGIDGKEFWNSADVYHFIGKDIAYHHYLFLPAIRLGIGKEYKLPDYIPTRGHLHLQSKKISKSRNWYIGLRDFLKTYPADYLRFYLLIITPYSQDDLNFDWDDFASRINSELIGNLGNFVNRSLGFTIRTCDGIVPEPDSSDREDEKAKQTIAELSEKIGAHMDSHHTDRALKELMEFSAFFNQYFQHKEPWKNKGGAKSCIYYSVNAVHGISLALYPFMPKAANRIWAQLGMKHSIGQVAWEQMSALDIKPGHKIGDVSPLFKKVDIKDIERQKLLLKIH